MPVPLRRTGYDSAVGLGIVGRRFRPERLVNPANTLDGHLRPGEGVDTHLPSQLAPEEFRVLASAGTSRAVLPGEELFRRGEAAASMFLVDTGEIRLSFDDGLADKLLGPGQYFGELAVFIGQHQRFARAVAETPGVLYEISCEAFDALLLREPVVVARFMQRSFAYLVAGEHQLVQHLKRRNEDLLQTLDTLRQTRTELTVAQQLVRTDDLTGLANRRGLYRYLDELGRQPLDGMKLALLLVDIDHFKTINDRSGHLAGDAALRAVAEEVRRLAGPLELPCRLGGDEFALVLRVADAGELANRALGLMGAIRSLRLPSLREHRLSVSVGGAFCADPGGWSAWYSQADGALYEAKRRGGDHWRLAPLQGLA
jgi:diguanylate cyclase (GGDEF)-like protein